MTVASIVHDPKQSPHDVATCVWFSSCNADAFEQHTDINVAALVLEANGDS